MSGGYERELADAEFGEGTSPSAVAGGVHGEIGAPGAGLGVNKIVDGVEGDRGTMVLSLFACNSASCLWRSVIKAKADLRSAAKMSWGYWLRCLLLRPSGSG